MTQFLNSTEIGSQGQQTMPASFFRCHDHFAKEMSSVFGQSWLCVARSIDLGQPGDFRVLQIGAESIILVRDHQQKVRGHFNLCRHRGTRLCEKSAGRFQRSIQCPYHAWTYGLDGRLIGVPDEGEFENFSRDHYPLHSVACHEWNGFIWIHLGEHPIPFESAFEPVMLKFDRWQLSDLVSARSIQYDVKANWKLIVQNYSECYHCAPVHPALTKLSSPTSGGNDLREGPFLGGYMTVQSSTSPGTLNSMTISGKSCGVPVGSLPPEDLQRVYYYVLFPNLFLSLHHDFVMVHHLWPQSPSETRIDCYWLFHPDSLRPGVGNPTDGVEFWDRVNREDWHVSELTQLGITSHRYQPGPYGNRESMSAAFDRHYLHFLNSTQSN